MKILQNHIKKIALGFFNKKIIIVKYTHIDIHTYIHMHVYMHVYMYV